MTLWRVIAEQETGEEIMVADHVEDEGEAQRIADKAMADHEEWRNAWIERHPFFWFSA